MKILYLRLENSAGIWAAMSKKSFELNLNTDDKIIMLFGENGSGKTTIVSALHPFTGSCNDDRKKFFLDGAGEKEIHYKVDNDVYIIRHYIKKQTKSYIGRMTYKKYCKMLQTMKPSEIEYDEELNENGGVRTFNDAVKMYLDVTEDYFKIARIGSNVKNFIGLSTADRKKYISTFLPDVEEYLQRYKVVNSKVLTLNKEIKYVADQITKLDSEDALKESKSTLKSQKKAISKLIENLTGAISSNKEKLKALDPEGILEEAGFENPYTDSLEDASKKIAKAEKALAKLGDYDIDTIDKTISTLQKNIVEKQKEVSEYQIKLNNSISNRSQLEIDIDNLEKKIKDLTTDDIDSLNEMKEALDNDLVDIQDELKEYYEKIKDDINLEGCKTVKQSDLSQFNKFLASVKLFMNGLSYDDIRDIESIFITNETSLDEFNEDRELLIKQNEELTNKILELKNTRTELEFGASQEASLNENRPESCSDDNCPYIKEIIKYKGSEAKLNKLELELKKLEEQLEKDEASMDRINKIHEYITNIESEYKRNSEEIVNGSIISKRFKGKFNTFKDFLNNFGFACNKSLLEFDLKSITGYFTALDAKDKLNSKKEVIESKISNNSKISKFYEETSNDIESKKKSMEELDVIIEEEKDILEKAQDKEEKLSSKLKNLEEAKSYTEELEELKKKYDEIEKEYNEAEKNLEEIGNIAVQISEDRKSMKENKAELEDTEDKLNNVQLKLLQFKEYTERKKNLQDNLDKYVYIKEATDPIKGIPVFFIEDYLNTTQEIANELLNLSQNGKFAIKFDVQPKDFFIQIYKNNGDILEDIEQASQGEQALTNVSLSLALMEQSMSKYNIAIYDEVDGPLDFRNRRNFIDMIDNQREKTGGEQVFIISHNNEFDAVAMGMILLNDNNVNISDKEFMKNKNVIFSV